MAKTESAKPKNNKFAMLKRFFGLLRAGKIKGEKFSKGFVKSAKSAAEKRRTPENRWKRASNAVKTANKIANRFQNKPRGENTNENISHRESILLSQERRSNVARRAKDRAKADLYLAGK